MKFLFRIFVPLLFLLIPATRGFKFKRHYLKLAGFGISNGVRIVSSCRIHINGTLSIGEQTWVGHEVLFIGGDTEIIIGNNCDIAPRVLFATGTHHISTDGPRVAGAGYSLPIIVGDGCWIGAAATILGGTEIGSRSIVAAGAVVRGIFPSECVIGGVPARVIKSLTQAKTINEDQ